MTLFYQINKLLKALQKKILEIINIQKIRKIINIQNKTKVNYPYSDKLQKKLALLIKNIEAVDITDLKKVEHKKIKNELGEDLFTSYRLDFHSRDDLEDFKKKI